jgi:hypothetical protein
MYSWMAGKIKDSKKYFESLNAAMIRARRFNITDNAGLRIRDAMASYPEYLCENSEFAIPPFETTWIEFNSRNMLFHNLLSPRMGADSDKRVAYLIHKNRVTVFAEGDDEEPKVMFLEYDLNKPMSLAQQQEVADFFDVTRIGLDPFLWGHTMTPYLRNEVQRSLRDQHGIHIPGYVREIMEKYPERLKSRVLDSYYGSAGELRNVLGVLLMLNQPKNSLKMSEVPRKRGLIRGKPQSYFGYSLVDIDIDKSEHFNPNRTQGPRQLSAPIRWHEVRGHFCHNQAAKKSDHEHVWQRLDDKKWECMKEGCEARRWWREYPEGRGSSEVGFIRQDRRIKTKQDRAA